MFQQGVRRAMGWNGCSIEVSDGEGWEGFLEAVTLE